ncbi:universal stress protein [Pontibacillus litoralis]|uniref:UspA domain-containing protein n=1 Tax=Pontibacillus litoralis JSM 072002 TaxID=1385512 RepID=A0A0A5G7N2_9BACI|nr:universal stress protein [Pontibacillus litoralis]KGX88019.1 hypothetical protein N784_12500 [Pontibacillus litoralis JSM 072002]
METKPIIVAIDGSSHAMLALKEAIYLASCSNKKVVIVHVQPSIEPLHMQLFVKREDIREYQEQMAMEALKPAIELLKDNRIEFDTVARIGYASREICNVAQELDAHYIFVGSRGQGPIKGQVLGSVSNGVLHQAHCPVMIVKEQ